MDRSPQPSPMQLPERLEYASTTLERWRVDDTERLDRALRKNLAHLRPWMSWITHEPIELDDRRRQLESWERRFASGEKFGWAITSDGELIGGCDLTPEPDGVWNTGYWIDTDAQRLGHARRAVTLMTNAAFAVPGVRAVTATCDAANEGSNGVLHSLGFGLARAFDGDIFAPAETGRVHVYERTTPIVL